MLDGVKDAAKVSCDSLAGVAAERCVRLEVCHSDHLAAESDDFTAIDSNFTANGCTDLDVYPDPLAYFDSDISAHWCANANGNCSTAGACLQNAGWAMENRD